MERFKKYIYSFLCFCFSLSLLSCSEEGAGIDPCGILYLDVNEDSSLLTKASHPVTYESLQVAVLDASEDTVKVYKDYLTEVKGKRLILPVGTYTLSVSSNHDGKASWESPFYKGTTEVEVKKGEITNAQVVCQVANTKVSVTYSDDVKHYFSNYETNVSNASGELLFTRDEYRAGFFSPEKLTVRLKLTNRDGNEFTIQRVQSNVEPRYHYTFHFKLANPTPPEGGDEAGGDFSVDVDDSCQEVLYTIFIKEEDLFGKAAPTSRMDHFGENNTVTYKVGTEEVPDPKVTFTVPAGIQSLQVKTVSHQFTDWTEFDLMKLSAEQKSALSAIGFPLLSDGMITAGSFELSFRELITHLQPLGLKAGTHAFTLNLLDAINQEASVSFTLVIRPDVKISADDPIVWAKFATLRGTSADQVGHKFLLKKTNEEVYQEITEVEVDPSTGDVTALVTTLDPNTSYEYKLVSGEEGALNESEPVTFTTDDTPIVPNLSFDGWCNSGGVVYPNANQNDPFWDSGNGGAVKASKTPTQSTSEVVISGNAAYLHSEMATVLGIGAFAAGNIYTGSFKEAIISVGNPGAKLDFGRPYTGRPTKLTGYYRYIPKTVNEGGHGELQNGDMDKCSIYIALCDWTAPFHVNTQTGTFVDLSSSNRSILAYGELSDAEASRTNMSAYEKFEIDIKYRDVTRKPTYILIVASASKYGDYFTGGVGSTLYLDEFELSFDYNEKSFE